MNPGNLLRRLPRWSIGPLVLTGLLTACQGTPEAASRPPLSVQAEEARIAPFTDAVDTVSTMEALEEVNLAAQAAGRIQTLLVRQGDQVQQGQLL